MINAEQLRLIRASGLFRGSWYRKRYLGEAGPGIDPAEHYLRIGAAIGHDPSRAFSTKFYLSCYPDAAESRLNPLVHYVLHGQAQGRAIRPDPVSGAQRVKAARTKLLSLGFTDRPLQELADLLTESPSAGTRALAARELALWHFRQRTQAGYAAALDYLRAARAEGPDLASRCGLAVVELLSHHHLGDHTAAMAALERAALAGETTPDLILASATLEPSPEGRLMRMNRVLKRYGLPAIALLDEPSLPLYDRLTSAVPLPPVTEGPKVTVLVAAFEAEATLPTALRSLQEQTWQNLEILVLDDCSPGSGTAAVAEAFAARDPRIRLIRLDRNGGAYVARNHGLDEATGEYVTLHDADDWSHPLKIEMQVRHLLANPQQVGCMSEQARVLGDLTSPRSAGLGALLGLNTSSFMFHRARMKESAGFWDTVRFSADNEMIRRLRAVYGLEAVEVISSGPLSFQRESPTSITTDPVMGINGHFFGARKEYLDAQTYFRKANPTRLTYGSSCDERPFPVPVLMLPDRDRVAARRQRLDTVVAADFRGNDSSVAGPLEEICRLSHAEVGVFEMNCYDPAHMHPIAAQMSVTARGAIWKAGGRILTYGEEVTCRELILWGPDILQEEQRYLPTVRPETVTIVLTDVFLTGSPDTAALSEALAKAEQRAEALFGCRPQWRGDGVHCCTFLSERPDGGSAFAAASDILKVSRKADRVVLAESHPVGADRHATLENAQ